MELLPFSIGEIERARVKRKKKTPDLDRFTQLALRGTYPELVTDSKVKTATWYSSYLQTYPERDIRTLYNIGDLRDFQRLVRLLAAHTGQQLNMASLARDIGISGPTVKS